MLFQSRAYRAALNALLVEHDLGYILLSPDNPFAAKLKNAIISAMRVGCPTPFDENSWVYRFNHLERVVQLNFVAYGFIELGMPPLLPGFEWQSVPNPMVIRDIERKLGKASRYIQQRCVQAVNLRRSRLSLQQWGLADLPDGPGPMSNVPSSYFISELPNLDTSTPLGTFKSGGLLLRYYEKPRTVGSVVTGIKPAYSYPQVIVVVGDRGPLLIIRAEESASGSRFLCSLDATGRHTNWGQLAAMNRNDFVKKVGELMLKMGYGEDGRVELEAS